MSEVGHMLILKYANGTMEYLVFSDIEATKQWHASQEPDEALEWIGWCGNVQVDILPVKTGLRMVIKEVIE